MDEALGASRGPDADQEPPLGARTSLPAAHDPRCHGDDGNHERERDKGGERVGHRQRPRSASVTCPGAAGICPDISTGPSDQAISTSSRRRRARRRRARTPANSLRRAGAVGSSTTNRVRARSVAARAAPAARNSMACSAQKTPSEGRRRHAHACLGRTPGSGRPCRTSAGDRACPIVWARTAVQHGVFRVCYACR